MKHLILATLPLFVVALGCDRDNKPVEKPAPQAQTKPATAPVTKPIIPHVHLNDWCPEHGVPESICTRCNEALVAGFKAKGDWCDKHNLPKSQDITCHPEVADKLKAMAPKTPK